MAATFEIGRSRRIAAPPARVFAEVVELRRWQAWSPWEGMDPNLQRTYEGPATGVGSSYAWKGNRKVGEGRMTITEATAPSRIIIDLQFLKPFAARNETEILFAEKDGGTEVTWTMRGKQSLMMRIFGALFSMDKMIGRDFEKGLGRLAQVVEG